MNSKRLFSLGFLAAFLLYGAHGQTRPNPLTFNWPAVTGNGAPTSFCGILNGISNYGQPYTNTATTPITGYHCGPAGWAVDAGGGGTPGGTNGQVQYNNSGAFGGYASVPVAFGGTGATTASGAISNLLSNPVEGNWSIWCYSTSHCTPTSTTVVNVSDFTTCDGTTDNTVGIQAANDASAGGILNFPLHGSDCIISSTIVNAGGVWNLNGTNLDYSPCTGVAVSDPGDFTLVIEYGGLFLTCVSGTPTMVEVGTGGGATLRLFEGISIGPLGSKAISELAGSNVWIDDWDFGDDVVASQSEIESRGFNFDVDTSQLKLDSMVAVNMKDIRNGEFTGSAGAAEIELSNTQSAPGISYGFYGSYLGLIHNGNIALKVDSGVAGSITGNFNWTNAGSGQGFVNSSAGLNGENLTVYETNSATTTTYIAPLITGNLQDWTNSGVANGNVPVWNSGTGKWTPGAGGGSMTWPSTPGVTVCTGTPCTAWGTSLTAPSGTIVGTSDTQTVTNKTIDGVTPTTMGYVDPTSSIQTQLNGKQASLSLLAGTYTNGDWCSYASSGTLLNCNNAVPQVNLSLIKGTYTNTDLCTYTTSGTLLNCTTATSTFQPALSLLAGTYVDGDLCSYTASGTLLNCNTAPGGTGNMSDGSGISASNYFPLTNGTAHDYTPTSPSATLAILGAAPALGNNVPQTTSFTIVVNTVHRFTGSGASNATTPASVTTGFIASIWNQGTAAVTVVTGGPTLVCVPSTCIVPIGAAASITTDGTNFDVQISNALGSAFGTAANANTTGSGAAVPTGPTSSTTTDLVSYTGAAAQQQDSGIASANVTQTTSTPAANQICVYGSTAKTCTPTTTLPTAAIPTIPLTSIATQATNTVVMNATGGTASPTAVAMPTCTSGADLYNTTTSAWSCVSTGGGTPAYPLTITGGVSGGVVYGSLSTQLTVSPAGTANVLMKWGGAATAPGNSSVTDNGTAVTTTDTGGYVGPVFVANGTTAGFSDYPQGTTSAAVAPCNVANSICLQAPTSVTSQLRVFASAPATGLPLYTNSSGTMTETILPLTGSGPNVQSALIAGAPTYTAGASVTSCVQATGYTNSNERGEVTIVGGTATTGTICTVNFSTTLASAPGMCQVTQNGGTTVFSIGHGTPGTSSFTITSGISVVSSTLNVDYDCTP